MDIWGAVADIAVDLAAKTEDGRSVAALRGDARQTLDGLLCHELMGTGVGRSAFILAAVDLYRGLDADTQARFVEVAAHYEQELP